MSKEIINNAIRTFEIESKAISNLINLLDDGFEKAVDAILNCKGKLIITGMGKSGLVGAKIAATLASTGTPSFFLHPGEAYHGDLGMISDQDIVLAISYSGFTDEILKLIPFLEDNQITLISMTGQPQSVLAQNSTIHLNVSIPEEACPLSLAPTSSTTAAMVMGDALAVALMTLRNFKAEDFAKYHPGGNLGKRLLTRVKDVMKKENLPCVSPFITVGEVIFEISKARLGLVVVTNESSILGVVTDGDVRRIMEKDRDNFFNVTVEEIMTKNPKTIAVDARIKEAEELMRNNKIHSLLVTDADNNLAGVLEIYDVAMF
jgi:arabinose-5-phosphate isomerase